MYLNLVSTEGERRRFPLVDVESADNLIKFKVICEEEDRLCHSGRVCQASLEWSEGEESEVFYVRCSDKDKEVALWEASFPDDAPFNSYTDFDLTQF